MSNSEFVNYYVMTFEEWVDHANERHLLKTDTSVYQQYNAYKKTATDAGRHYRYLGRAAETDSERHLCRRLDDMDKLLQQILGKVSL